MRLGAFLNISFEPQPEMSMNRIKKCRNDCKANTEGSAPGKFFVFSYKITLSYKITKYFIICLSVRSQKNARMRNVTGTESYFSFLWKGE